MEEKLRPRFKKKIDLAQLSEMDRLTSRLKLNTVCKEAQCPNRGECHGKGIATFMILGRVCTRSCKFCDVATGKPDPVDQMEPEHVAEAIRELELNHAVITSVARDELPDQGVMQFVKTLDAVRKKNISSTIEVLIPDFRADPALLYTLVAAKPHIVNHNIETVERLQKKVRVQAYYSRSMRVLELVKKINPNIFTKSGIMVGLGETKEEVLKTIYDLHHVGCEMITIGQYLQPSSKHLPIKTHVTKSEFQEYEQFARNLGVQFVAAGPYVRSSYMAEELFNRDSSVLKRAMQ